jgi:hypothetical protein
MILLMGMGFFGVSFGLLVFFSGLGQLYVAFSQCSSRRDVRVLLCAFVCVPLGFYKPGGLHSVQRSRVPTSILVTSQNLAIS